MKKVLPLLIVAVLLLTACTGASPAPAFRQITQEEAKAMMDAQAVIILDVREQHEYDEAHILNAVLLPVGTITADTAAAVIPNMNSVVLVYCRSGNRSKQASQKLVELGYTNIYEFGGINEWTGETMQGTGETESVEDVKVVSVKNLIEELPALKDVQPMNLEDQRMVYDQTQAAYEAYSQLTEEEKDMLSKEYEKIEELFGYFNTLVEPAE